MFTAIVFLPTSLSHSHLSHSLTLSISTYIFLSACFSLSILISFLSILCVSLSHCLSLSVSQILSQFHSPCLTHNTLSHCVSIFHSLYPFIFLSVPLSLSYYLFLSFSVSFSIFLFFSICFTLSLCFTIAFSVSDCLTLSVSQLAISLSVYLCLFFCLFTCLSISV